MEKYHSYKPSGVEWIGEIPEHWEIKKLKHLTEYKNGVSFKSEDFSKEEKIPVIRIGDVGDIIDFEDCVKLPMSFLERYSDFIIKRDDILVGLTGGTIGKSGIYNYDTPSLLNQRVCIIRNKKQLDNRLLYYFVKSEVFIRYIFYNCYGGGQDNIGKEDIINMVFPFPTNVEQHQIVRFLDEKTEIIDKLISTKQRKIDLLKEQRTSIINQVITKGLDLSVKMKDSGVEWIGHIPEHWIVKKMKYFVKICNGSDYKEFVLDEGGYPVYGTGGVFSRCSKFLYDKVSVLLGRKGSVDRPQIVYEPFWTSDTTYYTEIKEDVSPLYFFHLVNQIQFDRYIYGSAIPSMTKSVYDDMLFPYPPSTEQYQIVEYLNNRTNEIDDLVSMEQKKINLLKEYRQSLISEVITGKIDVRTKLN